MKKLSLLGIFAGAALLTAAPISVRPSPKSVGQLSLNKADAQYEARAERYKCNPIGGPYPGYTGPYAYAAYYYGYPPDCGGFKFYLAPTFYGYGYPEYKVQTHHKRDMEQN